MALCQVAPGTATGFFWGCLQSDFATFCVFITASRRQEGNSLLSLSKMKRAGVLCMHLTLFWVPR